MKSFESIEALISMIPALTVRVSVELVQLEVLPKGGRSGN